MITIKRCNSRNDNFKNLVTLLDTDLDARYGVVQDQYNVYNKIESIDTVVVAYEDNIPVGCGCYKEYDNATVEIKRMFVKSECRGKGIAKMMLTELESWAVENRYKKSILETGMKQHEAINFYTNFGYKKIENYGQYIGNANSICMSKDL